MSVVNLTVAQKMRLRLTGNKEKIKLIEAGILDANGVHTQAGRDLMWVILFDEHEADLLAAVEAAEDKKSK